MNEVEIRLWRPQDGDILVVRNTEVEIDGEQAREIADYVHAALNLPETSRVMAVGRDWEVTVVREEDTGYTERIDESTTITVTGQPRGLITWNKGAPDAGSS